MPGVKRSMDTWHKWEAQLCWLTLTEALSSLQLSQSTQSLVENGTWEVVELPAYLLAAPMHANQVQVGLQDQVWR